MCLALCHPADKRIIITHFTDINARVPIKTEANLQHFLTWGRRLNEKGQLPLGGWISQALKQKKLFNQYFPKYVKIMASKFMDADVEGRCRWFDVTDGHYLQGVVLREKEERRVYIMTITPEKSDTHFIRWPLIISS